MKKLVVLYKTPEDADAFLDHYRSKHIPLVNQLPGLIRSEITSLTKTLAGDEGNFLLAELYFADNDSFKAAMKSPENAALGADLKTFADGSATIMIGDLADW